MAAAYLLAIDQAIGVAQVLIAPEPGALEQGTLIRGRILLMLGSIATGAQALFGAGHLLGAKAVRPQQLPAFWTARPPVDDGKL